VTTATIRLGFSDEELLGRRKFIGGSDSRILMSGDAEAIYELWQRKTGRVPEPDLSDNLAVQCGIHLEELNARWHARVTGNPVTHRNEFCKSPRYYWMACNLDGRVAADDGTPAVFEAKWMGAFTSLDGVVQRNYWQLLHNMLTVGVERAVLSILTGRPSYELFEAELDEFEAARLIEREREFWRHVETDTPPPGMKPVEAPVPPEKWRTVSLEGNNLAADAAARWLGTRQAAQTFKGAEKDLKGLVEPDVGKAFGYGVAVTRNKAGSLTIREN
jgi:predicted phage-related endonuclease